MDEEARNFLRRWLNDGEPPEPNEEQRQWIVDANARRHSVEVLRVVHDVLGTAEVNYQNKTSFLLTFRMVLVDLSWMKTNRIKFTS